jgi:hypothetical protein
MIHKALFRITILNFILAIAFVIILVMPAFAQSAAGVDIIPAEKAKEQGYVLSDTPTHPALRMTPDKSEIIKLDQKAGSIIIGNPNHINILADSSTQLIIVPRAPGASYFTVLDEKGNILMQRHVIVSSPKEQYVRVRRSCNSGGSCLVNSVYFCPDMCHEIMVDDGKEKMPAAPKMDDDENSTSNSADSALPPEPPAAEGAAGDLTDPEQTE